MKEITEKDIVRMLEELNRAGSFGITRHDLAPKFGGDRQARKILEIIRATGLAAVVSGVNPAGITTYHIAQNREEYAVYRRGLISRIIALAQAVRGLDLAYKWQDDELTPLLERVIEMGGQGDGNTVRI